MDKDIEILQVYPQLETKHVEAVLSKYENLKKKAMGAFSIPGRVAKMLYALFID